MGTRMALNAAWENRDKTIIRFTLMPGWNWDTLHAVLDRAAKIAYQVERRLDIIVDVRDIAPQPIGDLLRPAAQETGQEFTKRVMLLDHHVAIIGAPQYIRAMYNRFHLGCTTAIASVHFASTLEEARAVVHVHQVREVVYGVCELAFA